jgi:hypothetical protein
VVPDRNAIDEEHREQQEEGRVAAAERDRVRLAAADHHPAAGEGAEDAEDQSAYEWGLADELPALDELAEHVGLALGVGVGPAPADLLDADQDGERGRGEGERVEVQRDVDRGEARVAELAVYRLQEGGQPGEQDARGDRRDPVRRGQRELVGRFEATPGQQVRHRRLFGGRPQQCDGLDDECRDAHPGEDEFRVRQEQAGRRDRREHYEADDVADDHRVPAVPPVGEHPGHRAEDEGRQQPDGDDGTERGTLGHGAADLLGGECRAGEEAEPVA